MSNKDPLWADKTLDEIAQDFEDFCKNPFQISNETFRSKCNSPNESNTPKHIDMKDMEVRIATLLPRELQLGELTGPITKKMVCVMCGPGAGLSCVQIAREQMKQVIALDIPPQHWNEGITPVNTMDLEELRKLNLLCNTPPGDTLALLDSLDGLCTSQKIPHVLELKDRMVKQETLTSKVNTSCMDINVKGRGPKWLK